MKHTIRATVAVLAVAFATPAFAGMTVAEDGDKKLTIGGKMFADFTQVDKAGTKTMGMNVTRFYFDTKYKQGNWLARVTTDINNEQGNTSATAAQTANGSTIPGLKRNMNVFLKYAYLEGKFSDEVQLRLGLSHTPWIDYEQHLWKHRFVSKVSSDHYKFDDSSDYGIGLKGDLAAGMANYWVTMTNGGGYGKPNSNGALDIDSRITIDPIENLEISAQYRSGYRGKKTNSATVSPAAKESLIQLLASYGTKQFRVGGNYLKAAAIGNTSKNDNTAMALWGWYNMGDMGVFGKYETNNDVNNTAFDNSNHLVAGVDFHVQKGLTLTAAVDTESTKAIAGTTSKTTKIGLYSEMKF